MAAIGIGNEEDNECPVCLQEIIPEELYVLHTINGKPHKFHRACITEWLRTTIETRAPFACPRCNQIDERAREELITTEGLARMPRLDLEALDHIPEDLWPPIALRLVGGIGIVTAVLSSYLVRMVFLDYERLTALDKTGSYLAPYVTTIGLYSGIDLVMTAKLGSPIKITPELPINFVVKMDY